MSVMSKAGHRDGPAMAYRSKFQRSSYGKFSPNISDG